MHITVDVWLGDDVAIQRNGSDTGVIVTDPGEIIPRATLYFGVTKAEIERTRARLNEVLDDVLTRARDANDPVPARRE